MCVCPEFKTFKRHVLTFVCLEGDEETCDESSYSNSPRFTPGGIDLSGSEKAEALVHILELSFSR